MKYYYECFGKIICIKTYKKLTNMLNFWLKRFCPSVVEVNIKINKKIDSNLIIEIKKSEKFDYIVNENNITIFGQITANESFIAKFITQCFQKILIDDDILIIPAACVANKGKGLLIVGDFWQGKTSSAINISSKYNYELISDNYVAIKYGKIIGATSYISIRKEDVNYIHKSIINVNDRFFYKNKYCYKNDLEIVGLLLPYINNGDNNIHTISKEESVWYLYQKFIRLLCGETILFDGKLPSPIFLNKDNSKKILNIVEKLLIKSRIVYVSSSMEKIVNEGNNILCKGFEIDE